MPERVRRILTSLWALFASHGLHALLGITGLRLSCVFAAHVPRSVRVNAAVLIELPARSEFSSEFDDGEVANRHSVFHKTLVGTLSRISMSPWCVSHAAKDGSWY